MVDIILGITFLSVIVVPGLERCEVRTMMPPTFCGLAYVGTPLRVDVIREECKDLAALIEI